MRGALDAFADLIRASAASELAAAKGVGRMQRAMRRLVDQAEVEARRPEKVLPVACGAGCGHCCAINVAVLFPEAISIAAFLYQSRSGPALQSVMERLADLYRLIVWLDDEERLLLRRSCAFLDPDGCCSIYPVRPLMCRSISSTDAERCRQAVSMQAFGETHPVLMNMRQKEIFETVFREIGGCLEDLGLDSRACKLTIAVHTLLREPGTAEHYLAGAPVPAG